MYQLGDHKPMLIQQFLPQYPDTAAAFGTSIALSADWLAIGAPLEDRDSASPNEDPRLDSGADDGAVYLYHRDGTAFRDSNFERGVHGFGSSLSLSGHELAVGAPLAQGCGTDTFWVERCFCTRSTLRAHQLHRYA